MNEVSNQRSEVEFVMPYSSAADPEIQCVNACGQNGCYKTSLARLACNLYKSVEDIRNIKFSRDNFDRAVEISQTMVDGVDYLSRHEADLAYTGEDAKKMGDYYKAIADIGLASRIAGGVRGKDARGSNDRGARGSFDNLKRAVEKISEKDKYGVDVFVKHILDKYDW
jgi:hypothetical protein